MSSYVAVGTEMFEADVVARLQLYFDSGHEPATPFSSLVLSVEVCHTAAIAFMPVQQKQPA
jgi:hypothetical protein